MVCWLGRKEGKIYSFAINLDIKESKDLPKREEIAKESLKSLNII